MDWFCYPEQSSGTRCVLLPSLKGTLAVVTVLLFYIELTGSVGRPWFSFLFQRTKVRVKYFILKVIKIGTTTLVSALSDKCPNS